MTTGAVSRSAAAARTLAGSRSSGGGSVVVPVAPTLSAITAGSLTDTAATITWSSDQFCSGQVEYGTTAAYGSTSTLQTCCVYRDHAQTITGLTAGTLYHYRVRSTNSDAQETVSSDGTFTTTGAPSPTLTYPAVRTLVYSASPSLTIPTYLGSRTHPTYGTKAYRITNTANQRHAYPSKAAFSATGRYIFIDRPPRQTLDGTTFEPLFSSDLTADAYCASYVSDYKGWTFSGLNIREILVSDTGMSIQSTTPLVALSGSYSQISIGQYQGSQSSDDRYLPINYKKSNGWHGIAIYDTVAKEIHKEKDIANEPSLALAAVIDNCGMSPSGLYIWAGMKRTNGTGVTDGTWVFDRATMTGRNFAINRTHLDFTFDAAGDDWLVINSQASTPGSIGSYIGLYRAVDKQYKAIPGWPSGHVGATCRAMVGGGFIASNYATTGTHAGFQQVVLYNVDTLEARPFFHSMGPWATEYLAEPHAVLSNDGTQVIFAARWGSGAANIYAYLARME